MVPLRMACLTDHWTLHPLSGSQCPCAASSQPRGAGISISGPPVPKISDRGQEAPTSAPKRVLGFQDIWLPVPARHGPVQPWSKLSKMTLLALVEDRPTPAQVYNWRVYLLAAVASCASCMIGYDSAFIGQTVELSSFREEFHFGEWSQDKQNLVKANIVSLYQAGAFFGALFAYPIGFYCGRKWGLLVTAIIFTLGSGLMLGANGSRGLGIMYAGRVLAGVGVGSGSNLTPIYISELSPPAIRGRLVGIYELGWQIGDRKSVV